MTIPNTTTIDGEHISWTYTFFLPNEKNFRVKPYTEFFHHYWLSSAAISVAYLVIIYLGQLLVRKFIPPDRSQLELKRPLFWWNVSFAVFSLFGSIRMLPELMHILTQHGFEKSVCDNRFSQMEIPGVWTILFAFSKVAELGDTIFLVLRGRRVIFLHWYHHITVLVYTWHACSEHTAAGRWFIGMNYTIHAFMYGYYALRTCGVRLPKVVPILITVSQISQMIMGCYIAYTVYAVKATGRPCAMTDANLAFCVMIYLSYAFLFLNFFSKSYLTHKPVVTPVPKSTKYDANHNHFSGNGHFVSNRNKAD